MTWVWEKIAREWLGDGQVAYSEAEVVDAFNQAEEVFGRDWIEEQKKRILPGTTDATGPLVTIPIIVQGHDLGLLKGLEKTKRLLDRLRRNEPQAWAELHALNLMSSDIDGLEIACEPDVDVDGRTRNPDWGLRTTLRSGFTAR